MSAELLRQRIESSRRFLKEEILERGFKRFYAELLESDQAALNEIEKENLGSSFFTFPIFGPILKGLHPRRRTRLEHHAE